MEVLTEHSSMWGVTTGAPTLCQECFKESVASGGGTI